jgi:hypothetical protein
VTGELDKLAVKEAYHGGDQIYTASGSGMHIKQIGHSIIHIPYRDLQLNNILYVPQSSKNLASIHRIASDNNVFLNFTLISFSLRIGSRELFFEDNLKGVYTLSHEIPPSQIQPSKPSAQIKFLSQGGMVV